MKILHLLLLTFFLLTAPALRAEETNLREETYTNLEVFANVLMLLQQHYVDTIDPQEVITGAINSMLTSLDPHSAYMNAEDFKELQEETHGSFSGIGIEITVKDGFLTVVSPIEDTPAYRAGLMAGDQIIAIDGEMTKEMHSSNGLTRAFTDAVVFGHSYGEVLDGAEPTLGDALLQMSFGNTAPGAPLPDFNQMLYCPAPGQALEVLSMRARASGPLREAFGVPEGTPGRLEMTQTGLIGTSAIANPKSRVAPDAFPAEKIIIRATGR